MQRDDKIALNFRFNLDLYVYNADIYAFEHAHGHIHLLVFISEKITQTFYVLYGSRLKTITMNELIDKI